MINGKIGRGCMGMVIALRTEDSSVIEPVA